MSKGMRFASASDVSMNSTNATVPGPGGHHANQWPSAWAATMSPSLKLPPRMIGTSAESRSGTSNDTAWAAARIPPNNAYLLLLAQPAIHTGMVMSDEIDR